jgi:hypothetical protein
MSKTVIDHLSHLVSPTTSGIIWLTDDDLNSNLPGVYELNYLLNGLLTKSIAAKASQSESNSNFFLAENFGNPFFLGHSVVSSKADLLNMHKHIELAQPLFNDVNIEVYIFNRSKNTANINILKELTNKYKDIQFENLNI